ncbi:hypothetical protein HY024_03195 [Candidatus Curtissbacteria bacterium]|nr:hypothetical protein [Candidatus Curtissbacteria bacterium]
MASYGKRPLWQWIVIYVIVGAVAYGLIYYFVFAKNGSSYTNNTGGNQLQQNPYSYPK